MTKVLVDSSVWSLALRRRPGDLNPEEGRLSEGLAQLIRAGEAAIIGPIRQEVLSGVKPGNRFEQVREYLRDFVDEPVTLLDYEEAARFYNTCRSRGIAGTHVDLLVCAVAYSRDLEIFTIDDDFRRYAEHLPIALHSPREAQA